MSAPLFIKVREEDNVAIAVHDLPAGTEILPGVVTQQDIPQAHKIALKDLAAGEEIIRYGVVLGTAINPIPAGGWINEHMLYLPESPDLDNMPYGNQYQGLCAAAGSAAAYLAGIPQRVGTGRNEKSSWNCNHSTMCRGSSKSCGRAD